MKESQKRENLLQRVAKLASQELSQWADHEEHGEMDIYWSENKDDLRQLLREVAQLAIEEEKEHAA